MTATHKKIGDIAVTAVSDGVLSTSLDVVIGLERAEAERLAGKKAGEPVEIAVNAFLLELDGVRALIDTGAGSTMGPTLGKLADSLRAAGTHRHHPAHPSAFRPFQRIGRRRRSRHLSQRATRDARGGSGILARSRRSERRRRAHPPQYHKGARDDR